MKTVSSKVSDNPETDRHTAEAYQGTTLKDGNIHTL